MDKNSIIFYNHLKESGLSIALVFAKYKGGWLLCKHKERNTWEVPGGHIKKNELPIDAAKRELYEETGAVAKSIELVGFFSVRQNNERQHGIVYFANILKLDDMPQFEMEEINCFKTFPAQTTYPKTYKKLLKYIGER